MLDKILGWFKKPVAEEMPPPIVFGRYSDNNKPLEKIEQWNKADSLFKEKKVFESIAAFFNYLRDDVAENVVHTQEGNSGTFYFFQGSKIIRGQYDENNFKAEARLAQMPEPSTPVMRRLLEMNFSLYYTRYGLGENLLMLFDSDIDTTNPSKLYYGLKELAIETDKQDDLLVQDFLSLKPVDVAHITTIPDVEKQIKYDFFKKWIQEALDMIAGIDADKYSGGIAYLLLALAYRIDYLIVPEGKLLRDIEKISEIYFKEEDRLITEKNQKMIEVYQKLLEKEPEDFFPYLFRSKYTFSVATPQNYKTIATAIYNANQNVAHYRENKMPQIAASISEFGLGYCQFSYSMPRPVTEFFHLFMMVNYADYFKMLGFKEAYYNVETNEFFKEAIFQKIEEIESRWREKYPELKLKIEKIRFDNQVAFNQSFTTEIEYLNLESK